MKKPKIVSDPNNSLPTEIEKSQVSEEHSLIARDSKNRRQVNIRFFVLLTLFILIIGIFVWIGNWRQELSAKKFNKSALNSLHAVHEDKKTTLGISVRKTDSSKLENDAAVLDSAAVKQLIKVNHLKKNPRRTSKKQSLSIPKKVLGSPNINGIYSGIIRVSELLSAQVLESGEEEPLSSFMVGYFNGTTDVLEFVSGNVLTEKLKRDLVEYNLGKNIFFTEMYLSTSEGKLRQLKTINLKISPDKSEN